MAQLTLARHGQASFLAENYDKLSSLGEEQARRLGDHWAVDQRTFEQVYFGPAERQIRTGEIVGARLSQAGLPWPEPVILPQFDEYPGLEVMRAFLPGLLEKHEDLRQMEAAFRSAQQTDATRIYDRLFQRVARLWASGELESQQIESWASFRARVECGLNQVRSAASAGVRVCVFTSGGVIAAASGYALKLDPLTTLELGWASRNASFSEFLFSRDRFSLASFNNLPHLREPSLITFR